MFNHETKTTNSNTEPAPRPDAPSSTLSGENQETAKDYFAVITDPDLYQFKFIARRDVEILKHYLNR